MEVSTFLQPRQGKRCWVWAGRQLPTVPAPVAASAPTPSRSSHLRAATRAIAVPAILVLAAGQASRRRRRRLVARRAEGDGKPEKPPVPWDLREVEGEPGKWYYYNRGKPPAPWQAVPIEGEPGKFYYYNPETEVTTWDFPEEGGAAPSASPWKKVPVQGDPGSFYYYNETTLETRWDPPPQKEEKKKQRKPPAPWQAVPIEGEPGEYRYYHPEMEVTTSDFPKEGGAAPSASPWKKVPVQGSFYYYNETTLETSWEVPEGFEDYADCGERPPARLAPLHVIIDILVDDNGFLHPRTRLRGS